MRDLFCVIFFKDYGNIFQKSVLDAVHTTHAKLPYTQLEHWSKEEGGGDTL